MPAKLIKRDSFSSEVRAKLDESRPKYSEAVKSLAAFCHGRNNPKLVFRVLVTHLDDACAEVREQCSPYDSGHRVRYRYDR